MILPMYKFVFDCGEYLAAKPFLARSCPPFNIFKLVVEGEYLICNGITDYIFYQSDPWEYHLYLSKETDMLLLILAQQGDIQLHHMGLVDLDITIETA